MSPIPNPPSSGTFSQDELWKRLTEGLSNSQSIAFESLVRGNAVVVAAACAGVNRSTLYTWLKPGHPFHTNLMRWKEDVAAATRTRLLALLDEATQAIEVAVKRGDARTALRVLEKLGMFGPLAVGPSSQELRAEKLRLENQKQAQLNAAQAETQKFLSGLTMGETTEDPSIADQGSEPAPSPDFQQPAA